MNNRNSQRLISAAALLITVFLLCLILFACLAVHVTPEMQNPLTVTISGASAAKPQNGSMALTASIAESGVTVTYAWFINGESAGAGETFVFDATWPAGYYRIGVSAESTDKKRAGNAETDVEVTTQ